MNTAYSPRRWAAAALMLLPLLSPAFAAAAADDDNPWGVYLLYNQRNNSNVLAPYTVTDTGGWKATPKAFTTQMMGLGVRYSVHPLLMLDGAFALITNNPRFGDASNRTPATAGNDYGLFTHDSGMIRLTANLVSPSVMGVRVIAGGGVASYRLRSDEQPFNQDKPLTVQMRAGIEWKPASHVGLAFFGNVDAPNVTNGRDYYFNKFSLEPTIAVYF